MPQEKTDEDSELPKATIDNLIHELTPNKFSISKEVKHYLRLSARLFINHVSLDANKFCETEKKKTITIAHVFKSMEMHGFGEFVEQCTISAKNYDEYSKRKPSRQNKFKECGKSMEELQEIQMKLFKQAAEEQKREYEVVDNEETEDEEK